MQYETLQNAVGFVAVIDAVENIFVRTIWDKVHAYLCQTVLRKERGK